MYCIAAYCVLCFHMTSLCLSHDLIKLHDNIASNSVAFCNPLHSLMPRSGKSGHLDTSFTQKTCLMHTVYIL